MVEYMSSDDRTKFDADLVAVPGRPNPGDTKKLMGALAGLGVGPGRKPPTPAAPRR